MPALATRRPRAARLPVRPVLIGGGVVGLELVVALGITDPRFFRLLLLLLAGVALTLVFCFPFAAACGLLVLTASINLPEVAFGVGPIDVRPYELLLGALLLVALVRPARASWGGWAGGALAAFLAVLGLSTVLAVSEGAVTITGTVTWVRPFFLYAFFFVVVRLFADPESLRKLLAFAAGLAAISGVVAALIALSGGIGGVLDFGEGYSTQTSLDAARRVRVPGVALAYALFWLVVVRVVRTRGRDRLLWSLALAGMALNIVVSQNRNMWIGLVVGCLLMLTFGGPQLRHRVVLGAAVLAAGLVVMLTFGFRIDEDSRFAPILARGTTLFDPAAVGQESSLTHRAEENQLAWDVVRENPVFGIGAGTNFGQTFGEARPDGTTRRTNQNFLHNQYLYLLMIGGVPLLVTFMTYLGAVLAPFARRQEPALIPYAVGLVMIMVSAVVMLSFTSVEIVSAIGLLTGAIWAWTRSGEAAALA